MKRLLSSLTLALVLAASTLTGCGSATHAPTSATLEVVITDSSISPNGAKLEVRQGGEVTLKLTSSKASSVHVHGYEGAEVSVAAGGSGTISFTADKLGSFDIESHDPDALVAQLVVSK